MNHYDWSSVDWAHPLPDDCVALFKLNAEVNTELIELIRERGLEHSPRASIFVWDRVICVSGINSVDPNRVLVPDVGIDHREQAFMLLQNYLDIGEMIIEDRKLREMDSCERDEYIASRRAMNEQVQAIIAENISFFAEKINSDKKEISELESLFEMD